MQQRLLLALYGLVWVCAGYTESLPKIRVHPSSVETGTVYQYTNPKVMEGLQEAPNVYVQSQGYTGQQASAIFRGLRSPHALVLLDGISLNDASAGQADLSHFGMTGADQVKVLSGPEVLLQSGQTAGVIQLNTIDKKAGTKGGLEAGSFDSAQANLKSTFKEPHATHTLLANHIQTAGLPPYGSRRIYGEKNRYHQENGGVISRFHMGERTWVKTHARAVSSVLKYDDGFPPLPAKPQATQNAHIYLVGAETNHESANGKRHHQLAASYAKQNLDFAPDSFAHTRESTVAYRQEEQWSWTHRTRFVADSTTTSLQNPLFKKQRAVSGLAALHGIRLTDTWSAEAGIRQDHAQKHSILPRLTGGVAWEKDRTKLYGSWRQATRLPTLYNLYAQTPNFQPNPALKREKMDLTEFGWKEKLGDRSTLQLIYFYNRLLNMMVGSLLNDFSSTVQNLPGHSILQGVETSFQYTWQNQISLKGHYTYTESTYGKSTTIKPIAPKHHMHVHLEIPTAEQWSVTPSLEYMSHRFSGTQHLPPYILNHFEITYTLKPGYQIYGQIKNLWDERYETVIGYRSPRRAFYVGTRFTF